MDDVILARLARLERENRRMKLAGLAITLPWIAIAMAAASGRDDGPKAIPKVVEAERFVLRDRDGKARAELFVDPDDGLAGLLLTTPDGETPIALAARPDGNAALGFRDKDGNDRGGLAVVPDGGMALMLKSQRETPRIALTIPADGTARLGLADGDGKTRAHLLVGADRTTTLDFWDTTGKARLTQGVSGTDRPALTFWGPDGTPRAQLQTNEDGWAGLSLRDRDGKDRASLGVRDDRAALGLRDALDRSSISLECLPSGAAGLTIFGREDATRVGLGTFPDGTPRLNLLDKDKTILFGAP